MPITNYMVDEIAVGVYQGDDNLDGVPSYAAPVVARARIEEKLRTFRKADGTMVSTETDIATVWPVKVRDRVWMAPFVSNSLPRTFPPGFVYRDSDARTPKIMNDARKMSGNDGHTEVSF